MYQPSQPTHQRNKGRQDGDADLTRSLQRLAISATPSPSSTPRSPRPSSAMHSPFRSTSASVVPSSRSATPALLRKASMSSLHSANGVTPSRRASFAALSSPGGKPRSGRSPLRSASPELPEKPIPTPHSVASAHFKVELDIHHGPEPTRRAETVVILQDACYGHRYSRPRASRAQLSTIVERPERIKACVLGVSAAYVRLGERHQDGAFPLSPDCDAASLPSIPFRIQKSARRLSLSSQTVTNVHGTKWMEELKMMCDAAEAKLAGGGKELQRPDIDRGANAEAPQKFHEGDLYLCSESLEAMEGALGGVCDAVDAVFRPEGPRRAFVAIRPPGHHCSASHPSGFCWINNVHVGIMHAVLSHGLTHAAIIDFDLHHGDGSQSIAWQHNARSVTLAKNAAWWKRTSIGYFSLHDINSYPCEMGDEDKVRNASICIDGAHGQSVWNVHLEPWETEADFWALYESKYAVLLQKTRTYLKRHTERLRASGLHSRAAIFLSAGFDASEHEGVGMQRHNVNVPTDFYARFTRDVVRIAAEEGTSVEGRIVSVLEGGYSDRALCSGVFSHLCGLAGDGPSKDQESTNGYEAIQKDQQRARKESTASERGARRYEASWWSRAQLDMLEEAIRTPPPVPKPVRNSPPPTYSSPTQASQAKVVTLKNRRSISGLSSIPSNGVRRFSYEPPPSPDVPWTIATHELSKLLIPSGRQTTSCTAEDLNAEATRVRRERQAALTGVVPAVAAPAPEDRAPTRMSLRERKTKPAYTFDDDELDRKLRRKTVAGPTVHAAETASRGPTPAPGKQHKTARRLSAASSLVSSEGKDSLPSASRPASVRASSATDVASGPEPGISATEPNGSNLNVKKTRVPVKKEPVLRASRAHKKQAAPTNGAPQHAAGATGPSAEKAGDEMDKLAGEMKKIKITVLTKAQKEARERERAIKDKLANAETISVAPPPAEKGSQPQPAPPSAPTATSITNTAATLPSPSPSPYPSPAQEDPQLQSPTDPSALLPQEATTPITTTSGPLASPPTTDPRSIPLPTSSPSPPPPPQAMSSPLGETPITAADNFIPHQPDGPTPKPTAPHPQQLQRLPPNVSATPVQSPARREDLPVFTSTSIIPFSPTARGAGVNGSGVEGEGKSEGGKKPAEGAEGSG